VANELKFNSTTPVAELHPQRRSRSISKIHGGRFILTIDWTVVGTLVLLTIFGLGLRVSQLGAIGFAEDEMNKLEAVHAYDQGNIAANGEHPMMMKAMMFVSLHAARAMSGSESISEEAALRMPNALFGALTVIPLFLLTAAFFDRWTGLLTAALWAFGITAATFNRIGKEDTLLVFFMLFAFYFYLRARQISPSDQRSRWRNYLLSSVSFGLMLASKYFPHYFGLNALYHHNIRVRQCEPGEPSGKTPVIFYLLIGVVFLLANPAVLLPQVWTYLDAYMGERLLVHTGYFFGGQLYQNTMSGTPFWGTPIHFYALFMAIKIPLLVLITFLIGLIVSIRRWRHPGYLFALFMFIFWIVPYSLVGSKWLRYTLSLMPFVYMLSAIGIVAVVRYLLDKSERLRRAPLVVSTIAVFVFVGIPALTAFANAPHYALYTNPLGAGRAGYYFPHDEFYDDGLREAIQFVCDTAPQNAIIAHETPGVARYYLRRFNRTDLQSRAMSAPNFDPLTLNGPAYIIAQRGRVYFENQKKLDYVRANFRKVHEVQINGLTAAEVFINQR
jgi:dolichyl-phosphate-mannose-protein mannosyltransferase